MSLEQAIEQNTLAINALVDVWKKLTANATQISAKVESGDVGTVTAGNVAMSVKPAAEVKKPQAPAATATAAAGSTATSNSDVANATTSASTSVETSPSELTYADVGPAISAKVRTDRDHVVKVLAAFGVKKGTELVAAQYAEFMKALG